MTSDTLIEDRVVMGERNFEAAIKIMLSRGQQTLKIFHPDLRVGNFQSRETAELIQTFLSGGRHRQLTIILHDAEFLASNCPHLINLLKTYGHTMKAYLTASHEHVAQDILVLADASDYLHRFHVQQARFRYVLDNPVAASPLHQRFQELLEATTSTFSTTPLGL